jgi:uncharacterized protein involved in high-affinity Fe2+ transport
VAFPAVNFDRGGEGIAYHDRSPDNVGGQYRPREGVDISASADLPFSHYQVQSFENGEWMSYTVDVQESGNYDLSVRAANPGGASAFRIEVDGANVTGSLAVAATGSAASYQWFGKQGVPLAAGRHVLKLLAEGHAFNVSALSVLPSAGYAGTPYAGTAPLLPGTLSAADFDKGGEGVAYHDLSARNLGGEYRPAESVDIYASAGTASGGWHVHVQAGEWMKYTVNVMGNGSYELAIRASNNYDPAAFHIEIDGMNATGTVSVPKTGSWSSYRWFGTKGLTLGAGKRVLKLVAESGWFDVSAIRLR